MIAIIAYFFSWPYFPPPQYRLRKLSEVRCRIIKWLSFFARSSVESTVADDIATFTRAEKLSYLPSTMYKNMCTVHEVDGSMWTAEGIKQDHFFFWQSRWSANSTDFGVTIIGESAVRTGLLVRLVSQETTLRSMVDGQQNQIYMVVSRDCPCFEDTQFKCFLIL